MTKLLTRRSSRRILEKNISPVRTWRRQCEIIELSSQSDLSDYENDETLTNSKKSNTKQQRSKSRSSSRSTKGRSKTLCKPTEVASELHNNNVNKIKEPKTPEKLCKTTSKSKIEAPSTPSVLLGRLNLNSPPKSPLTSPNKRKILAPLLYRNGDIESGDNENGNLHGSPPKQRKEINDSNKNKENISMDVLSPSKSSSKKLFGDDGDIYSNARKALHSSYPTDMPGREKELEDLKRFITELIDSQSSGSLYVSGPPGTGKTASLNLILSQNLISSQIKHIYINCTAIKSSSSIYQKIVNELGLQSKSKSEKDCYSTIENYLKRNHKTILLVLDEIDQLESKNQSILYTIFEWPSIPKAKLILIGIANALDLTDRILPRLQARCELKPKLLHFAPYTKQQIIEIFNARLKSAGVDKIFTPVALQMLAGKVAAISGDVRRALDIGRRVIEYGNSIDVLKPLENLTKELEGKLEEKTEIKSVNLTEVVNVLNNIYGASQNFGTNDTNDTFPLQQKIIVCCLILILKKGKNKDITIGRLFEIYRKICIKRNIHIVDHGEFFGLCSLIEIRGMIRIIKKKDPKLSKINLMWDEQEVASALRDKQLMASILEDVTCLGKM